MRFHFVKQLDAMQCGVACLAMICKFYKNAYSIETLSKICGVSTEGVSLLAIKTAAETRVTVARLVEKLKKEMNF